MSNKINQIIVDRKSWQEDEGCMGFHDYVTNYENYTNFVNRVTEQANNLNRNIINIVYPEKDITIIIYDDTDYTKPIID